MQRILLIKRSAIGDILMITPLIRQLKTKCDCEIDILTGVSANHVLKENSYINKILSFKDCVFSISGILKLGKILFQLRSNYDYVFVLDKHWYFAFISKIINAPNIGFGRDKVAKFFLTYSAPYNEVNRYQALYYLDLLKISKLATPDYTDLQLDFYINEKNKITVNDLLHANKIDQFMVLVNSGGNNSYESTNIRMLPTNKIIDLIKNIRLKFGGAIILLGGASDYENYGHYQKEIVDENLFNFAGKLNLAESAYLISRASKFYTTDCGPMHLGVAVNMRERMLAFFGPTNPQHFLPKEYIDLGTAVWSDSDIYDPRYQMYGHKNNLVYFTRLVF